MTNFHFLVPLLGLSGHVYRTLVWGIHFGITQDDFIVQLTESYFDSRLFTKNELIHLYSPKEASGLPTEVRGFKIPLLALNGLNELTPSTQLGIYYGDYGENGVSWTCFTRNEEMAFSSEGYLSSGVPISREEFFSKCFE